MSAKNNHINYIELYATDLDKIKEFYSTAFGWSFKDYGSTYASFSGAGLDGGFEQMNEPITNGALVILFHNNLAEIKTKIEEAQGVITKDIFSFPGGKRFHFTDPSGNELAVWCTE